MNCNEGAIVGSRHEGLHGGCGRRHGIVPIIAVEGHGTAAERPTPSPVLGSEGVEGLPLIVASMSNVVVGVNYWCK